MAGHCVAAIVLKRDLLDKISILPRIKNPECPGCLISMWPDQNVDEDGFIDFIQQECVLSKSGPAAEYTINGKTWLDTSDLCKRDSDYVYEIGTPLHKKKLISFDGFIDQATDKAFEIIQSPINWFQIERLAKEFMTHKTLSSSKIKTICQTARTTYLSMN